MKTKLIKVIPQSELEKALLLDDGSANSPEDIQVSSARLQVMQDEMEFMTRVRALGNNAKYFMA